MRKLIAAINMTLDGVCDHTAVDADEELHQHYADLINGADTILYGRITYQLMEYWRTVLENPTGEKSTNEFAVSIDKIQKIVFSRTLENTDWKTATLARLDLKGEVAALRTQEAGDILVGSPGLIVSCLELGLLNELQICIHPVVAGKGQLLFNHISNRVRLDLISTKRFRNGAIILYYDVKGNE